MKIRNQLKYTCLILSLIVFGCTKEDPAPPVGPGPDVGTDLITIVEEDLGGIPVVIVGSVLKNFIIGFEAIHDGTLLDFEPIQADLPSILTDQEGNVWDIFGQATEGPRQGQSLTSLNGYIGFWFSWSSQYPGINVHEMGTVETDVTVYTDGEWDVQLSHVYQGAGADAILALDDPSFVNWNQRDYIENEFYTAEDEIVVGVKVNGEVKFYPQKIFDYHEIINDVIGGEPVAVIYCPFTATTTAWGRTINGVETTFGVSGYLFNNNIMPYDRNSVSVWSQMQNACVHGPQRGDLPVNYPVLESKWSSWKLMYKDMKVLSDDTGFGWDYDDYPYGTYRTDQDRLTFPLIYEDRRLPLKERIYGVAVNGEAKAFRFSQF